MVRDYKPSDRAELERLHAQMELDYRFPDVDNPLFLVRKVVERDGKVVGSLLLRLCAEAMLLLDDGHPKERFDVMRDLQDEALAEAYRKGLADVFADVPPINFAKRLKQLGWEPDRPGWTIWSHSTK